MLTIECVTDLNGFLKTKPFWDALVAKSGDLDIPFLTFDWLRLWWKMFGNNGRMFILVLKRDGEAVAGIPLMQGRISWRGFPVNAISSLANDQSGRSGLLGDTHECEEAIATALRYLADTRARFDLVWLDYLPEESAMVQQLDRVLPEYGLQYRKLPGMRSPYIRITGSWNAYLQSRSRNLREKIKRTANGITRDSRYALSLIVSGNIQETMEKILAISRNTWKYREKTAIANSAANSEFFRQYAEHAAKRQQLKIMLLEYDGRPIAFTYELKYKNRDYFIKTGFDENYARLSPGIFILSSSIQEAFGTGCTEYDLLGSNEEYKMKFTDTVRPHSKYWIFNTGTYGRLLHAVERNAVPLIKRLIGKKRGGAVELTRQPAHSPRAGL